MSCPCNIEIDKRVEIGVPVLKEEPISEFIREQMYVCKCTCRVGFGGGVSNNIDNYNKLNTSTFSQDSGEYKNDRDHGKFSSSDILAYTGLQYKVRCLEDSMLVEIRKTEEVTDIYLDQLKHYPDPACQPHIDGTQASLLLSLDNVFQCGVTRVVNQLTVLSTLSHMLLLL
ncbi:hypothetical protein J6590_060411 [Homalodisca vitripennis]|nr:hypothetical protein J6590_060411 [Homalodisca vitripennis]